MTTPNHQPTPPPGMEIIPSEYLLAGNPLPGDAIKFDEYSTNWTPSYYRGEKLHQSDVDSVREGSLFYATAEILPCFPITPTFPSTGGTTKEKGGEQRPIPTALYPCKWCAEDYSLPAEDLFWSNKQKAWVCRACWDYQESENLGLSLQQEIESRK